MDSKERQSRFEQRCDTEDSRTINRTISYLRTMCDQFGKKLDQSAHANSKLKDENKRLKAQNEKLEDALKILQAKLERLES